MPTTMPKRTYLVNRELSWLDFNGRVLEEAGDSRNRVLDRLKFIAIFSSNLDEFYMVRVAGLRQQLESGSKGTDPSGLSVAQQLAAIRRKTTALMRLQYEYLMRDILPELRARGTSLVEPEGLPVSGREGLSAYFEREILPVLTPVAVDPSHPFPMVSNRALQLVVALRKPESRQRVYSLVEVPAGMLSRYIEVGAAADRKGRRTYVALEDLVRANLGQLFPGREILHAHAFRVTRDMDLDVEEEGVADLLSHLEKQLRGRRRRKPIRLEISADCPADTLSWLQGQLELDDMFVHRVPGPIDLTGCFELVGKETAPGLVEEPWEPCRSPLVREDEPVFESIRREGTIPLFHPFESFGPVVRFLEEAAEDPDVLAIKQTLYRVSGDSPVVRALQRAAENGKQVTVIVELKARFDEERNIAWARRLEESGAHVVYGIVGLKIHCKALLVIRREDGGIQRYLHLATGNYNDTTARLYTDIGLFVTDPDLCSDVAALFNVMTGYAEPPRWRSLAVAPFNLRERFLALIDREARLTSPHRPGNITAKMNSLVDAEIIDHLFAAARKGVEISLIVRGVCCLRPAPNMRNLRIVSVVDRYLEHSRIYRFANGGRTEYYMSSADWMPRNLDRRIETLFPVSNADVQRMLDEVLEAPLADRYRGRRLRSSGSYARNWSAPATTRSQANVYESFRAREREAARATTPGRKLQVLRSPRED